MTSPDAVVLQPIPVAEFPIGNKSMNAHIHLLESFTQPYRIWQDDTLRQRLEERVAINRDKISIQPGVMNLMLEAEAVLGRGHDPKTERTARLLLDHALANGWDEDGQRGKSSMKGW